MHHEHRVSLHLGVVQTAQEELDVGELRSRGGVQLHRVMDGEQSQAQAQDIDLEHVLEGR